MFTRTMQGKLQLFFR